MNYLSRKLNKKDRGFTLIELIVVIAILAILAVIAIPRLSGFSESARQASDKETAAVICNAAAMYYASNPDMAAPASSADWIGLLEGVNLINAGDDDLSSNGFTALTVSGPEDGVVSVKLTGAAPLADYTISK